MEASEYEKSLSKNGIDLDNPKDVEYLYKWAQHREKAYDTLKRQLSISIAKNTQLEQELIELKESKRELVEALKEIEYISPSTDVQNIAKKALTKAKQS